MKTIVRTLSAAALAGGLAITLAASASAQQDRPPPPGAEARQWDQGQARERFEERREQRQRTLHEALGLRGDQEGAWQAFLAAQHRPDREHGAGRWRRDGEEGQRLQISTPERLDRMAERMAERQARFAERADAIKRFYAVLDPRQRATFDGLFAEEHAGMGGFGRHHHMGPGGRPPEQRGERERQAPPAAYDGERG